MHNSDDTVAFHAKHIADEAGVKALDYFRKLLDVDFKSDESPVTQADRAVEAHVRDYLKNHFPRDGILGEEFGFEEGQTDWTWIVDPIDGTRSFLSGNPLFGFLLARLFKGLPDIGVIGMPALNEVIVGQKDLGATLNGQSIHVSDQTLLAQSILYVNEAEKISNARPALFTRLMNLGQTRRFSYDCYPHALLAMGHVDAVIDYDLQPYDYLPLIAVIEAAGGTITNWNGDPLTLTSGTQNVVSAATPKLHTQIIDQIGRH